MEVSKHFKVLWCMLETFCFGGIHYGWTSLVYVFKREGFFADECTYSNGTDVIQSESACDEQNAQLALLYSLSNGLAVIPIFLCGNSLSRFGVRKTRLVWTCIFMVGCMLVIVSSPDMPWFACIGLGFIAGGGTIYQLTGIQLSRLYKTGSFLVIMLMSGCYDSSSAMMLFVKFAYEAGITRRQSFGVILGLSIMAIIGTFVNFKEPSLKDAPPANKEINVDVESTKKKITAKDKSDHKVDPSLPDKLTVRTIYRTHLCSRMFISHVFWFTLLAVHFAFIIAASNVYYISRAADNNVDEESSLTNVLSLALFTGIVPAICTGLCLELFKKKQTGSTFLRNLKTSTAALFTTTTLSAILSVLFMLQTVYTMYAAFIVLPIFRAILFSVVFSFIARTFPPKAFGSLSAPIEFQSCFSLFIQRAFIEWLQAYDDSAIHIEITFLVLSALAMFHPIALIFRIRSLSNQEKIQAGLESVGKVNIFAIDPNGLTGPKDTQDPVPIITNE